MIRTCIIATILSSSLVQAQQGDAPEQPKHRIFSPNPPACAAETVDNIKKVVDISVAILPLTKVCAEGAGWSSSEHPWAVQQNLFAPSTNNKMACAQGIVGEIGTVTGFISSMLALSFDCFNNNEGCGQSITNAINDWIDIAGALIQAAGFCRPPGPRSGDATIQGFNCWRSSFHTMQKVVQAAKFIDTAINTCNPTEFLPIQPLFSNDTGAADDAAGLGNATELLGGLGPEASDNLGASWDGLQQPLPFTEATEDFQVAPVERRLRAAAGNSLEGAHAKFRQLRAKVSELTRQLDDEGDDGGAKADTRELFL